MKRYDPALVAEYVARINKVLDYAENHLDEPLDLQTIAGIAGFSPFHFHRIFSAMLGETLYAFTSRLRLEKAARLLCTNGNPITQTALDCGFSSAASFSRAFKAYFSVTPTEFKQKNACRKTGITEDNLYQALRNAGNAKPLRLSYDAYMNNIFARRKRMKTLQGEVKVEVFPQTTVAYVRHIGPYAGDAQLFERLFEQLYAWAVPKGHADMSRPQDMKEIVIYHDDPGVTEPQNLRISVCLVVPEDTQTSGEVGRLDMPQGRYARGRFLIDARQFGEAWQYMCGVWMPGSGYQPDDGYCFESYHHNPRAQAKGLFDVSICVPVRPM